MPVRAGGVREQILAQNRSDRRVAVVRGEVDDPVFDHIQALDRNPAHGAGVVDAKKHDAALGVGERHQLARELFGIGRRHASFPEADILELGAAVLAGAQLIQNLVSGVEHRVLRSAFRLAAAGDAV